MSTHREQCIVCDRRTYCTSDSYGLSAQGGCYSDEPAVWFCSMACFRVLHERMAERLRHVTETAAKGNDMDPVDEYRRLLADTSPVRELVKPVGAIFRS